MATVLIEERKKKLTPIEFAIECLEEAQRSNLKQVRGQLVSKNSRGEKSFCALGAILHIGFGWGGDYFECDGKYEKLYRFGIDVNTIEYLNDNREMSFAEIADTLKKGEDYAKTLVCCFIKKDQ